VRSNKQQYKVRVGVVSARLLTGDKVGGSDKEEDAVQQTERNKREVEREKVREKVR
jgi:hypothetical protein